MAPAFGKYFERNCSNVSRIGEFVLIVLTSICYQTGTERAAQKRVYLYIVNFCKPTLYGLLTGHATTGAGRGHGAGALLVGRLALPILIVQIAIILILNLDFSKKFFSYTHVDVLQILFFRGEGLAYYARRVAPALLYHELGRNAS
jgi:hypothetical protein